MALVTEQRSSRRPRPAHLAALLGLVAVLLVTLLVAPDRASAAGISGESVVHTNRVTEGDGTRVPDIISTSETNAVVVWREGTTANVLPDVGAKVFDHGYIRYSYTTNGGTSWSRPQTLAQETSEYSWHYVTLFETGGAIYAYLGRTSPANRTGLPINAIVAKKSTDEGHTWQDVALNMPLSLVQDAPGYNLALAGRPLQLGVNRYVMPYWETKRRNGLLYSTDLVNWERRAPVNNPLADQPGEPQLVVSQDDPDELLLVARNTPATGTTSFAMTATTTDEGEGNNWTDFQLSTTVPSNDSKGYFTKDSAGRYLTIYNSAKNRLALNYKVKPVGKSWLTAKPFADGPADTTSDGSGWDAYPMADEYAPGKFYVVWEYDTSRIKVAKLDISDL
ncbi:sialidase family protein [Streptomyces sp. NBC_00019]|uniref:sialidase family protein n=1 Tax=Streptomyces sp. NBC_00019 TaxID=2975623 RepID=UPI00324E368A